MKVELFIVDHQVKTRDCPRGKGPEVQARNLDICLLKCTGLKECMPSFDTTEDGAIVYRKNVIPDFQCPLLKNGVELT